MSKEEDIRNSIKKVYHLMLTLFGLFFVVAGAILFYTYNPDYFAAEPEIEALVSIPVEVDEDRIENGIHVRTGFIDAEGLMTVVNNCTNCHSSQIIIQNRMNTERWNATIKWMQETQNLWDLGGNQEIIVNYLVTNYPVVDTGRRENLANIDWYELKD
tara:strand:- start:26790 stop:27263 length:474 start_codon:yes stop_codon:yes gene_type:complete